MWSPAHHDQRRVGVTYLGAPDDPNGANAGGVSGAGDATITHIEPIGHSTRVEYRGSVAVGIVYNQVLGAAQQQASALASYSWTHEQWTLSASASAATTLPWNAGRLRAHPLRRAAVAWAPAPVVQLQTGVRGYAQVFPPTAPAVTDANAPQPVAAIRTRRSGSRSWP